MIGDGGMKYWGDIVKGVGGGGDGVMVGRVVGGRCERVGECLEMVLKSGGKVFL